MSECCKFGKENLEKAGTHEGVDQWYFVCYTCGDYHPIGYCPYCGKKLEV